MSASQDLKNFGTPEDLKKFLDEEMGKVRTMLGDYLRRLEETRAKSEKMKKAHDALIKFAGEKQLPPLDAREIDIMGLKIIVNPGPKQEMESLEEVVKSMQDRLNTIQKVRKAFDPLSTEEGIVTITAVMADNLPIRLMIYLKP